MKYAELGPPEIEALRLCAALERTYPEAAEAQGNRRASVILAGHAAWRAKTRSPLSASPADRQQEPREDQKTNHQ